jgi:hypothetical protein
MYFCIGTTYIAALPYRGYCLGPMTLVWGHYLEFHRVNSHGIFFYVWLYSLILLRSCNGVETISFFFERSIRAEVVTYRLYVAFGFLHTQQLRGFDESRNNQVIIQNRSFKISTIAASLHLPSSYSSFRILRLAQKIERMENGKNRVFWPFGWRSR